MKKLLLSALIASSISVSAFAAETYHIDPVHTNVLLKANHIGFSNVYLKVHDINGEFVFDRLNPEKSSVNVTMKAKSIDGFDETFNEHLHGVDFFNVEAFPKITFVSDEITVTGDNTATILGDLTIKGLSQPTLLNVTFNKEGENPFAKDYRAGFSGTGVVKRSEYGINTALPAVADEVGIVLEIEGIRKGKE
ncbi:MAG: YceI family protein [Alphaproteobacteria bacterium]|nr:YceI family protein [Alphaproteobacteria bacterium]